MKRTRKEAIEAGDEFYYTGKPCKNGHIAKRRTLHGNCVECQAEYRLRDQERMEKARIGTVA